MSGKPVLKSGKSLIKFYGIGLTIILILVLTIVVGFFIKYWFDHNELKFQSPIVFQQPMWVEPIESPDLIKARHEFEAVSTKLKELEASEAARPKDAPIVNKVMQQSDASIIKQSKHPVILWVVYGLESTWGKEDGCKAHGKFNGFGFMQQDDRDPWVCYDSFEQVVKEVDNWFEEKLAMYSLQEALCGYNLGFSSGKFDACMAMSAEVPYLRKFVATVKGY